MVFVTGGTGLLGTHILLELLSRGNQVRALKRSTSDPSITQQVFQFYLKDKWQSEFDKIEWIEGDLSDISILDEAIKGCTHVYHAAAMVSFIKKDFKRMWKVNKEGTENIVNVCLSHQVKQLCYVSSTSAVAKSPDLDLQVESTKWKSDPSNSNYAVTKYAAELEIWRGVEEGLDAVIVNPSIILGPGNWNESSISIFKVVKNGLKFFTPGENAFVDARDVATIMCELSERNIVNDRFLVISENRPFKSVFDSIAKAFNVKAPSTLVKPWMAAIAWRLEGLLRVLFGRKQNITKETARSSMSKTHFSNTKIKEQLNFQFIPVDESIQNAVNFFNR